jgi:hypothetical protein
MSNFEKSVIAFCVATGALFIPLWVMNIMTDVPDYIDNAVCCAWMFIYALWLIAMVL